MEDDTTTAVVLAVIAAGLLVGLFALTDWWARREKRLRDQRPGEVIKAAARATEPEPAEPKRTASASILRRVQPSWPLVLVVAMIAGMAGAALTRMLGPSDKALRKQVEDLRGDVDDVRDAVVRLQRGY